MLEKLKKLGEVEEWDWDGWPLTDMGFWWKRPTHYKCYRTKYANGYGASIVKHPGTYGFEDDLWELAVIKYDRSSDYIDWNLNYDTPITNDVVGNLTEDDVVQICERIKMLNEDGEEIQE